MDYAKNNSLGAALQLKTEEEEAVDLVDDEIELRSSQMDPLSVNKSLNSSFK